MPCVKSELSRGPACAGRVLYHAVGLKLANLEIGKQMPDMTASTSQRTRELIREFFTPERRSEPYVSSLVSLCERFIEAGDLATRLDAFVELKEWTVKRFIFCRGKW